MSARACAGQEALDASLPLHCELCGRPAYGEDHHIRSRGAGGPDIKENRIRLCGYCHPEAQEYKISPARLVAIVAAREGQSVAEIYRAIGWVAEGWDGTLAEETGRPWPVDLTFEVLDQFIAESEDREREEIWSRALMFYIAVEGMGMTARQVAAGRRVSAALVRKRVKTFAAFPTRESRCPELDFEFHYLAAGTDDPEGWLQKALEHGWSTRQMQAAIKVERGEVDQEEQDLAQAERALRYAQEVIQRGGAPADWLIGELRGVLASAGADRAQAAG